MSKYTVFVEIATGDDPPWEAYRHIEAPTLPKAKSRAVNSLFLTHAKAFPHNCYRVTRVFKGFCQEVKDD